MERPRWLFDELAHAGAEHLDPALVALYDEKIAFDPGAEVELLRGSGLTGASTLVDLGAGTGALALAAAPFCRRVVAVDPSPAMLSVARGRADAVGAQNVEIVQAGFLTYDHAGEPADLVYSRNALHHLPDFWKVLALERIAALTRPGGVLRLRDLVYSFSPGEASLAIEAWLAHAPDDPRTGWTRDELERHVRDEHSTFSWLLEPMLQRAGFELRDVSYDASGIFAAYVCVKRPR